MDTYGSPTGDVPLKSQCKYLVFVRLKSEVFDVFVKFYHMILTQFQT